MPSIPSVYRLKHTFRRRVAPLLGRWFGPREPFSRIARWGYHRYLGLFLRRVRDGRFTDVHGLTFNVDPESLIEKQMAAAGYWEEDSRYFIAHVVRPGDVVIEVGSNVGAHTLPLAKRVGPAGRVYGFEPTGYAMRRLKSNLELNPGLKNVTVFQALVSSRDGVTERSVRSYWASDGTSTSGEIVASEAVKLDRVFAGHPRIDVLKIDVDGADLDVLRSARGLIRRHRPIVFVEVSHSLEEFGGTVGELWEFLTEGGYELSSFDLSRSRFRTVTLTAILEELRFQPVVNVLAVPRGGRAAPPSRASARTPSRAR